MRRNNENTGSRLTPELLMDLVREILEPYQQNAAPEDESGAAGNDKRRRATDPANDDDGANGGPTGRRGATCDTSQRPM